MQTLNHIYQHKIVAIIRGVSADKAKDVAFALAEGGVKILEITLNSPKALQVIEQLADSIGNKVLIGAGTVLDPESARAAIYAGAKFILSPTVDINTIHMTRRHGAVSIPGAYTPTEILNAYAWGGDIVKVFPASAGVAYIKDVKGPLPQIPIMPTGGVGLDNIKEFKKIGAVAYGIGSSLVDAKQTINDEYLKQLTSKAKQFIEAVQ
ncbi:bifunctional 4-hydroxy-2-oxoglutarate aldolase/2-dehydro-3-deoxy-phosphogluconate aldolase [Pedobacter puniceum]|uniref:Bifunctional 4-hydroxy-2-oxoglutarate aldolase/2-dehydro-3-deoxy-phosphogluconate aldolase n=1 Tax=Pedobacter puniceum TaxID=2666136 RepID=A0A7K0FP35_9SPHI|nr:bifunctional 4-hydroxy-2-oxoglutarate aldolase/2-dehydro-3-deoxy-phosphogluconate aldolase [Pedobacter puniceum]MRX47010.1 bifunctional 4-hydroxy-2-oxoglutarate aldolase/2-dehydro-3-deoxy-phosphogluconate aldolase [Pedobacter puniceum]